jgi:hypothetical protein
MIRKLALILNRGEGSNMAYKRKTRDEYEIQGDYGGGYEMVTTESTWRDARAQIKCYRENEPGIPFRIKKIRIKIQGGM